MESYFLTDTGRVREHNEDSVTILKNINDEYLLAVADGMGGHKAGEVASSIWHNSVNCATWFDLKFCDVFWKWKFDDSVFEAEPCINLILFNRWQFLWVFGCPKVSYNENNYMYWEALLDYVYDYYDIYITKEQFEWVSYITDENGNEDKVTCWTDEWLTKKGKEKVKYESDKYNKYSI